MLEQEPIRYEVVRNTTHYTRAVLHHYRRVSRTRWVRRIVLGTIGTLMSYLAIVCLKQAYYAEAILMALTATIMFSLPTVMRWIVLFRHKRVPGFGQPASISLTQSGLRIKSANGFGEINWSAFTAARRLTDGFLLYQGPLTFEWLPDEAIASDDRPADVEALLRERVADYRVA